MFLPQPRLHSWCCLNDHQHQHHHHQQQQQQQQPLSGRATRRQRGVAAAAAARRQQRRQQQQLLITCRAASTHSSSSSSEVLVERTHDHNWRSPLAGHDAADPRCRPVLALGKFDALHKGHQALAAAALQLGGSPVLLSFSGMGAVLGWAPRKPLVAPCDRPRVLHLWAQQLADQQQQQQQQPAVGQRPRAAQARHATASTRGHIEVDAAPQSPSSYGDSGDDHHQQQQPQQPLLVPVRQRYVPFAAVRSLSPEAFVDIIGSDFRAAGVVAGENYRFGYKAAGDTALLQALSGAAGLRCAVVPLVGAGEPGAVGTVSSSRIRQMLDSCRIEAVRRSLGRPYRLVAELPLPGSQQQQRDSKVCVPLSSCLNQHPAPGVYRCSLRLYVGTDRDGDLLQLQQEFPDSSSSSLAGDDGASSSSSSSVQVLSRVASSPGGRRHGHISGCSRWCVAAAGAEVEVAPDGLLLPRELFDAAEACLNNAAALSSSSSSSSSGDSDGSSTVAVRPTAWDTDDRDDDKEEGDQDDEAAISTCLLALDFESCLMQLCALR